MNRLLLLPFLFITFSKISYSQVTDPKIIRQFADSGRVENAVKEGKWVEYSLDSIMLQGMSLNLGNKTSKMNNSYFVRKSTGNYLKGERTGSWTEYETYSSKPPFHFERRDVCDYKNGKKDGEEINYQGYSNYQVPLLIRHWKEGVENGTGKNYSRKYPFNLQQSYEAVDGRKVIVRSYYSGEKLECEQTDTIIKKVHLIFLKHHTEKGPLDYMGFYEGENKYGTWTTFYESGKVESISNIQTGNYKYYYENGQLCTERIYRGERLVKVVSNYTEDGKKNNPGTVKNGTGTMNIYDPAGKLTEAVEYVDGVEKKK